MSLQGVEGGGVMGAVAVDICVERPSVEDQRDGADSEERISSIRSEMSV